MELVYSDGSPDTLDMSECKQRVCKNEKKMCQLRQSKKTLHWSQKESSRLALESRGKANASGIQK